MRISDWSSDVCSADLQRFPASPPFIGRGAAGIVARLVQRIAKLDVRGRPAAARPGRSRLPEFHELKCVGAGYRVHVRAKVDHRPLARKQIAPDGRGDDGARYASGPVHLNELGGTQL